MLRNQSTSDLSTGTRYVPLKRVNVDALIHSFAANVTITQVFRNDETTPIEAVYCFPIEEKAAIYSFTAQIDDREIVAQLKEKREAQQEYAAALQQGHGAYLLEQDEQSQDSFIISVGALPPSKECTIKIAYVTELEFGQGSSIRFVVPTTIAPRYNPEEGGVAAPAGTNSNYVQSAPYTIEFRCQIDKIGSAEGEYIARIDSPSHPIQLDFSRPDAYLVTLSQQNTHLDRDILVNIELSTKRTNTIAAVQSGAVMAVFTPTEADCRRGASAQQTNEFLFVIDCSGSMQGESKIDLARQAMLLFLKSLPVDCHFNIIRFGSSHESLFPQVTAVYNEANAQQAERLIQNMQADLGGTELMAPLQWLDTHPPSAERVRQVFLLTDGEISNVSEVLDLCRSMATSTRIFSFGLGHSPSRSLVKGLARSTNGRFVFVPPKSSVDTYVGQQLQYALQPCITDLEVHWHLGVAVRTAPLQIPPVFANDRLLVYALIDDRTAPFDHQASVVLKSKSSGQTWGTAKVNTIPSVAENETIARLAAKALILELQHEKTPSSSSSASQTGSRQSRFARLNATADEETTATTTANEPSTKKRIIALSLQHHILSPHTAFVGVEKRSNGDNKEMVLREVPIEISTDDRHLQSGGVRFSSSRRNRMQFSMICPSHRSSTSVYSNHRGSSFSHAYCTEEFRSLIAMPTRLLTKSSMVYDMRRRRDRSRSRERVLEAHFDDTLSSLLPSKEEETVRDLIQQQKFDGLWDFTDDAIDKLTEKPLSTFQSIDATVNRQILVSLIVVVLLETRFASSSSLWYGVVQKARQQIKKLLDQDSKDMEKLADGIRQRL